MANVNSISSNSYGSTSSLYGTKNILSGLASGMDTETMIQNSVSGYQTKIATLQQSQTKIEWKQDAYREIIDQMNSITQKYTSYTSKTNLASNAFFTSARKTEAQGGNAEAITATGSAKSDIQIDSVTQLATAARYAVDASALNFNATNKATGTAIDWSTQKEVGQVSGTITLKYGSQDIELSFDEKDTDIKTADKLKEAIEKKLADVTIKAKDGSSVKASALISVSAENGTFTFEANKSSSDYDGSSVYINSVSGNVTSTLGASRPTTTLIEDKVKNTSFTVPDMDALVKTPNMAEYLSGKKVDVTLDGTTKTIKIGDLADADVTVGMTTMKGSDAIALLSDEGTSDSYKQELSAALTGALKDDLQASVNKAFGSGKITVSVDGTTGGLHFDVAENSGSTVKVSSSAVGETIGLGKSGVSNYLNTASTLKELLGTTWLNENARIAASGDSANIRSSGSGDDIKYYDADSNRVAKGEDDNWYRVDDNGKFLYSMEINGKQIGKFTEDTALENVLTAINSDAEAGVSVSYSNLTSQFVFTARETGASGKISFDNALAGRLFGGGESTDGQDAIISATVNGKQLTLTRSSNVVEMDGLSVTLKKAFTTGDAVTFKTSSDSDKVVDTIKEFVDDVNKLMQSVHDAYATAPLTKSTSKSSSNKTYEPLTEEDKADMSETAIKAYEEKAKTGLLFGDTDLSQLYSRLLSTVQATGTDRMDMEAIGLTTTYSNGVTQLSLNEDKLRAALDSDPDKVRNVFAKTTEGGAKTNGLMASLKATLNSYGSTSLGSQGILVRKAGTKLSAISLMNNNLQKQIDNITSQIEQWQTRLSDKVDYYTKQFTQLEKLMATMNNQSSMLSDLSGY